MTTYAGIPVLDGYGHETDTPPGGDYKKPGSASGYGWVIHISMASAPTAMDACHGEGIP